MNGRTWGDAIAEDKRTAQRQREYARRLADKLAAGELLADLDAQSAAAILRMWADRPADNPKRGRGQDAQFAHWEAALTVALLQRNGKQDPVGHVAEIYGVSVQSIRKAMKENKADVEKYLARWVPARKNSQP